MNKTFRQLLMASATGVMALGAYAQPPSTATDTDTTPKTPDQAYNEYQTAATACSKLTGLSRSDCIGNARDAYDRAMAKVAPNLGGGHASPNGSGGTSGAGGGRINKS